MPESYSVNQLKTWDKCQKKYEFDYIRQLQWPANPKNFRLGKAVHQLLDYGSRQLPLDSIIYAADEDVVLAWRVLSGCDWASLPVIASEWGFSLNVEDRWIYGRIDRIVRGQDPATGQSKIHILDWKTGTSIPLAPDIDWQTRVYLYAVYEAQREFGLDLAPEDYVFSYIQVQRQQVTTVHIPYRQALHDETAMNLKAKFDEMEQAQVYRLPAACPDRYCPYGKICGIQSIDNADETADGALTETPDELWMMEVF